MSSNFSITQLVAASLLWFGEFAVTACHSLLPPLQLKEAKAQGDLMHQQMEQLMEDYTKEINSLRRQVTESKEMLEQERRKNSRYVAFMAVDSGHNGAENQRTPADVVVEHIKVEKSLLEKKV